MITDFLKTNTSKTKLSVALEVLQEFKANESQDEWMGIPFVAWAKLEQLEEFLEHLVNAKPLENDTVEYMKKKGRNQWRG